MKKTDILFLIGDLNLGGTEKHLISILPKLENYGLNIGIYTFKEKGLLSFKINKKKILFKSFYFYTFLKYLPSIIKKPLGFILTILNLYYLIKIYKPKVLHMFLPEAYYIGSIATYFNSNIIKVMSRRSKNYFIKNSLIRFVEKHFHKRTNYIIANSKSVLNDLQSELSDKKKIELIYNGIYISNINKFNISQKVVNEIKLKYNVVDNEIVISMIANLIPYKNHFHFIEVLSELKKNSNKKIKVFFVGQDRGIKKDLIKKIKKYKLNKEIVFIHNLTNPDKILMISDISVLCSKHEGFSNSILEAMSFGLPILASNVGGNSESVINNHNGKLYNINNNEQFYNKLKELLDNKKIREKYGKNSLKLINEKFNIDYCVNEYISFYNKVLK